MEHAVQEPLEHMSDAAHIAPKVDAVQHEDKHNRVYQHHGPGRKLHQRTLGQGNDEHRQRQGAADHERDERAVVQQIAELGVVEKDVEEQVRQRCGVSLVRCSGYAPW